MQELPAFLSDREIRPHHNHMLLFRDMVDHLKIHVIEIEKSYRGRSDQDIELAPRIIEFVRLYIPPQQALRKDHPALEVIGQICPDVAAFYRDEWIPEMERKLGAKAALYKQSPKYGEVASSAVKALASPQSEAALPPDDKKARGFVSRLREGIGGWWRDS